jgi:hypothetical protein
MARPLVSTISTTGVIVETVVFHPSVAMRNKRKPKQARPAVASEARVADAMTVGWMLTAITALVCQAGLVAVRAVEHYQPEAAALGVLGELLLFAALVFGVISLVLAPIVLRLRRTPVPPGITIFAVAVGFTPLAIVAWRSLGW